MVPYGIMQPVYGFFSDNFGKARLLQWTVCGLALGTVGCDFTSSLWVLCIFRAITGFLLLGLYSYLGAFLHEVTGLSYLQVGTVIMF